jgi:hypothetical protein
MAFPIPKSLISTLISDNSDADLDKSDHGVPDCGWSRGVLAPWPFWTITLPTVIWPWRQAGAGSVACSIPKLLISMLISDNFR